MAFFGEKNFEIFQNGVYLQTNKKGGGAQRTTEKDGNPYRYKDGKNLPFFQTKKHKKRMEMQEGRVTRDVLRAMSDGESLTVLCPDGYALDSYRNTAYSFQKIERCRYECHSEGLLLTITRHDDEEEKTKIPSCGSKGAALGNAPTVFS